ncbi:MAG: diaminopimelate decarboxylase [Candidatus Omnitrophota bacterium]
MTSAYETHSRFFQYRGNELFVENVLLREIAQSYGTPTYVYSQNAILDAFNGYRRGLDGLPHLVAFAVKANGNQAILHTLAQAGSGADLTSGGELALALRSGIPADRMIYSGVGKTDEEIREALRAGILMFNVESEPELETIDRLAQEVQKRAPVSFRVNPDIDAKTHPKITTGLREHKFGIFWESAVELYRKAAKMKGIEIMGISSHIGSSLQDATPLLQALDRLLELKNALRGAGIEISRLDLGGGLGIQYQSENPDLPEEYAAKVREKIRSSGATLILEPGRSIVGNAGVIVCRVLYVKRTADRTFIIVDAAMNDLARPAIYGAYHEIVPVRLSGEEQELVDVAGPICESSDVFGKQRPLPPCQPGDLLAICSAGAYGFAMASRYNGRVMPAEAMAEGERHWLIRRRETYEDLFRHQMGF